jgi:hypothetical protein
MFKKYCKYYFQYILLILSSLISYYLFLIYYDSTTGLDWVKYSTYINHLLFDTPLEPTDGQSFIYYYFISKVVGLNVESINDLNKNIILSNGVHFGNFLLQLVGFLGIFKYFSNMNYDKKNILYSLTVINFFPPLIYLRLTFKSEILAFTLLPWVLLLLNKLKEDELSSKNRFSLILLSSVLLTIKPSITLMVSLAVLVLHSDLIRKNVKLVFSVIIVTALMLFINYEIIQLSFISHNTENTRWDNVAPISFFYTLKIKSLLLEPMFNIQSNSLISVLLLDTYGDYFTFFWKHKEPTNFLAYGQVNYFSRFHVNRYLRDYLGILFSILTYLSFLYYYFKSSKNHKKIYIFPFIGIIVLTINSLGIPSKNFDPNSADTFKVHYFAFFLALSFVQLLLQNKKLTKYWLILIPVFIFIMGFPKTNNDEIRKEINFKIQYTNVCFLFNKIDSC